MTQTILSLEDMTTLLEIWDSVRNIQDAFHNLTGCYGFTTDSLLSKLDDIETIISHASPLFDPDDDDSIYDHVIENKKLSNKEKAEYLLGLRDIPVSLIAGTD